MARNRKEKRNDYLLPKNRFSNKKRKVTEPSLAPLNMSRIAMKGNVFGD
jgi:hypothetical protein